MAVQSSLCRTWSETPKTAFPMTRLNIVIMWLIFISRKTFKCSPGVCGKPLSHWDATSSRWVCESIHQTVANCRETFAWYRKVLACIANSSRTGRQSFKHVILFCATKNIAKPSPSHRICREPVANQSPTLRRRSQTHRKEVSAICTMRQICDIIKTISRLNCDK